MTGAPRRWLFADMLGPHYVPDREQRVLLIESSNVLRRKMYHRRKAHLILSALRHRAAELGERAVFVQSATYAEGLRICDEPVEVPEPTSYAARAFVRGRDGVQVVPNEGWSCGPVEFATWAGGRGNKRLLLEDFYRWQRARHGVLMDGADPAGGTWNLDHENREPPPQRPTLGVPRPYLPREDAIDDEVRRDLDRMERDGVQFLGRDGPRHFAVTRAEARRALDRFVDTRLDAFGPHEDAMLAGDRWMAHSLLSVPLNLGLLHPLEVVGRAEDAWRAGSAPLASVEGFVRQVLGWREYIYGMYGYVGPTWRDRNALGAAREIPAWFAELDADQVDARCLSHTLAEVRDEGWVHHIPRLMVLGNWALQRGYRPAELTDWFHRAFVDGYDWVMLANVVGMSQYADGGLLATKPYASGGAYIDRMSDFCGDCRYDPRKRTGETACPFTAGYWSFLHRAAPALRGNHRMSQPLAGLGRLKDLDAVVAQEDLRGDAPP